MKLKNIVFLVLGLLICISPVLSARSAYQIGLGSFATIKGIDALYTNPAGVGVNSKLFVLQFDGATYLQNNLLVNDYIDDTEKEKLLDNIGDSNWLINLTGQGGMKLAAGPVMGFVDLRATGNISLHKDLAELLLEGNEIGQTYSIDGSHGNGAVYGDTGFNIAFEVPETENVFFGFTYHRLMGAIFKLEGEGEALVDYSDGDPTFTGQGEFIIKHTPLESIDGPEDLASGSAFDLGVYTEYNDKISLGFSLLNIGSISSAKTHYQKYVADAASDEKFELVEENTINEPLEYTLPLTIKFGADYDYLDFATVMANYSYTNYQDQVDHQVSIGHEYYQLGFLPIRLGLSYSSLHKDFDLRTGFGLHLGPFEAEVGISDLIGIFHRSRGVEAGITARLSF